MDTKPELPAAIRPWAVLIASALALLVAPVAWASHTVSPSRTRYAKVRQVCPPPKPRYATCFALIRIPVPATSAASAGAERYTLNDGASSSGPAGGLTPAQLAGAYGYDPAVGGTGQTVAIIDAYNDPNIEADLATFDSQYGLPACTSGDGCLKKVGQTGSEATLPEADTTGWSVEISLDVETVHSACPNCKILLVEANQASDTALAEAVNQAVKLGATEVSNSYGGPEVGTGASERSAYNHPGVVIAAAAGDDGYDDWDFTVEGYGAFEMPNAPASLPSVVAVGGTSLELNSNGSRTSETVWNDEGPADELEFPRGFIGGGGCSRLFTAQPWQQSVPGFAASGCEGKRLASDIAAVADPYTGFDIYDSYNCGPDCEEYGIGKGKDWVTLGGTSLATPLISSLYALAGGSDGVHYPALTLYGHLGEASSLYDVTEGGNGYCDTESKAQCGDPNATLGRVDCEGTTACNAGPGYDGPSGVGTPNGLGAFKPLFPTAVIVAPSSINAGVSASFSASGSSDPYPGGSVAGYSWNWGDGTAPSVAAAPTHTYAAPGTYSVSLVVTDSYGIASSSVTRSAKVLAESHEEEVRREEEAATRKAEEEAEEAATRTVEEEAATRKEGEEAAKQKAGEEAVKQQAEREALAAIRRAEEAAATKKREEEKLTSPLQQVAGFNATVLAPVPDVRLLSGALVANASGVVTIKLSCPVGESSCKGTVALRTLPAVIGGAAQAKSKAGILMLASGLFAVAGGHVKTLTLQLTLRARTLLARLHTVRIRATLTAHDPAGATHTTIEMATLRQAKVKHRTP